MIEYYQSRIFSFFLIIIPVSIILGSSISLTNIICLGFLTFFFIFKKNYSQVFYTLPIKLLFLIYLYLIFNTLISIDPLITLSRNFGFIRFIFLFIFINYFFYSFKKFDIFKFWLIFLIVVLIDSYVEVISGTNILGYGNLYGDRIVSFFKDEPVVAAFFNGFLLILIGYLANNINGNNKKLILFFAITLSFLICIFLTGERSNTIKILFAFIIFLSICNFISFKKKILTFFIFLSLISVIFLNSNFLKYRFISLLKYDFLAIKEFIFSNKNEINVNKSIYLSLYYSGYQVFKENFLFGVGNKNYRIVTCDKDKSTLNRHFYCMTHPHQIYFELLSEHGLIGTIILLVLFFTLIFKYIKIIINSRNHIQLGCLLYLLINFLPILPSGSFFSDFNITLFFINLSIMYAVNDKTNIFNEINRGR